MRFTEQFVNAPLIESKDYGSAGIDAASVTLGKVHVMGFLLSFGALTGNSTLTIYAGASRSAKTTAIAFKYRLGAAVYKAALADQFGDVIAVASTGLVLVAGTFAHKQVAIEIDADAGTEGQPWVTLSLDNVATVLNLAAFGVGRPRNSSHLMASVL